MNLTLLYKATKRSLKTTFYMKHPVCKLKFINTSFTLNKATVYIKFIPLNVIACQEMRLNERNSVHICGVRSFYHVYYLLSPLTSLHSFVKLP